MKKMTKINLQEAFSGESQAHMKYIAFAEKAEKENFKNIARLFRANSFAEQVHAVNHLRALSEINSTGENLETAIEGEGFEVNEMYPVYIEVARKQEEKEAEVSTSWALAAEKVHEELYKKAKEAVDKGKDIDIDAVNVCSVCGFTVQGEAPEKCPVCGSPRKKFKEF